MTSVEASDATSDVANEIAAPTHRVDRCLQRQPIFEDMIVLKIL